MREVKFRGKCINEDAWAYGSLIQRSGRAFIFEEGVHVPQERMGEFLTEVIPASIGEYTGLKDCRNHEIYAGSIVRFYRRTVNGGLNRFVAEVYRASNGAYRLECIPDDFGVKHWEDLYNNRKIVEVIGNRFEIPAP